MDSKKVELFKAETRMVVTRGWGWRNGEMLVIGYKLSDMQVEQDLDTYSTVTVVSSTILYT